MIEVSCLSSSVFNVKVKETHCSVGELLPNVQYEFWVTATNTTGISPASEKAVYVTGKTMGLLQGTPLSNWLTVVFNRDVLVEDTTEYNGLHYFNSVLSQLSLPPSLIPLYLPLSLPLLLPLQSPLHQSSDRGSVAVVRKPLWFAGSQETPTQSTPTP